MLVFVVVIIIKCALVNIIIIMSVWLHSISLLYSLYFTIIISFLFISFFLSQILIFTFFCDFISASMHYHLSHEYISCNLLIAFYVKLKWFQRLLLVRQGKKSKTLKFYAFDSVFDWIMTVCQQEEKLL